MLKAIILRLVTSEAEGYQQLAQHPSLNSQDGQFIFWQLHWRQDDSQIKYFVVISAVYAFLFAKR